MFALLEIVSLYFFELIMPRRFSNWQRKNLTKKGKVYAGLKLIAGVQPGLKVAQMKTASMEIRPGAIIFGSDEIQLTGFHPEGRPEKYFSRVHQDPATVFEIYSAQGTLEWSLNDITKDWAMETVFPLSPESHNLNNEQETPPQQ